MLKLFYRNAENIRRSMYWKSVTNLSNTVIGNMQSHMRLVNGANLDPDMTSRMGESPFDAVRTIDMWNDEQAAEDSANFSAYSHWANGLSQQYTEDTQNDMLIVQHNQDTGLMEVVSANENPVKSTDSMFITRPMYKCIQAHSLRSFFLHKLAMSSNNPEETIQRLSYRSSIDWRLNAAPQVATAEQYQKVIDQLEVDVTPEQMKQGALLRAKQEKDQFREISDKMLYKLEHLPEYPCETDAQAEKIFGQLPVPNQVKFLKAIYGALGQQEVRICLQITQGYMDNMVNLPTMKSTRKEIEAELETLEGSVRTGSPEEDELV